MNKVVLKIKTLAFLLAFWAISFAAQSQKVVYSPQTKVSLLTCAPGVDLYAGFGHTSIRVVDPARGIDWVYNYGVFNFNTPNFYVKFARGMLKYMVIYHPTSGFLRQYQQEGRQVIEQELNLTKDEKHRFLEVLRDNYNDEKKRYYMYDFFYNNCATQIRDILKRELKPTFPSPKKDTTFREMLDVYISDQPWLDLGIDLILGLPADKKTDVLSQMFLPDYLFYNMSQWKKPNGEMLLGKPKVLIKGKSKITRPDPGFNQPFYVFWGLFGFVLLTTFLIKSDRLKRTLDGFFLFITGFIGIFVLVMWFGTNHDATQRNLNALWANPLYFYLAFAVWRNRKIKFTFGMMLAVTSLLLVSWSFFPQKFNTSLIPIFLIMIVRAVDHLFLSAKKGE